MRDTVAVSSAVHAERAMRYPMGKGLDLGGDVSGRMPIVPHEITSRVRTTCPKCGNAYR